MTEYTRAKLYEQLEQLRTTLEEAVDAGDVYEYPARALPATTGKEPDNDREDRKGCF